MFSCQSMPNGNASLFLKYQMDSMIYKYVFKGIYSVIVHCCHYPSCHMIRKLPSDSVPVSINGGTICLNLKIVTNYIFEECTLFGHPGEEALSKPYVTVLLAK